MTALTPPGPAADELVASGSPTSGKFARDVAGGVVPAADAPTGPEAPTFERGLRWSDILHCS